MKPAFLEPRDTTPPVSKKQKIGKELKDGSIAHIIFNNYHFFTAHIRPSLILFLLFRFIFASGDWAFVRIFIGAIVWQ